MYTIIDLNVLRDFNIFHYMFIYIYNVNLSSFIFNISLLWIIDSILAILA